MKQNRHDISAAADVTIMVNEHVAFVQAAAANLVAPLLRQQVNRFFVGGPTGTSRVKHTEEHFSRDQRGLIFFSGLVPRVQRALERQGCHVVVVDQTHCDWLDEAREAAQARDDLSDSDERLLDAVCSRPHGQLLMSGDDDIAWAIALMAAVFADRALMIISKNKQRAGRLHALLGEYSSRRFALYPQLPWRMAIKPWAVIGNPQLAGANMNGFELLIFTDTASVLSAAAIRQLQSRRDFLCYGFVSPHARLADRERFQLEELLGPVTYRQPAHGPQPAEVNVVLLQSPLACRAAGKMALDRKRALVWHNDRRNQRIADLAKGIQYGWRKRLITRELLDETQLQAVFRQPRPSVAILVESTEHGDQLQRLLRSWELLTRNSVTGCIPTVSGRQIATMAYADEFGVRSDVLIRADGGVEWPLSAGAFPRASLSPDQVAVVDMEDPQTKRARRNAQRLRNAYHKLGWNVIGRM